MKILFTILGTALVFGAGVFAGTWMQRHQPVPPPPMGMMGEIRDVPFSGSGQPFAPHHGHGSADLNAEMERIKPEIEAFQKKLEPIKSEFKQSLEALLNPEQKQRLQVLNERGSSPSPAGAPPAHSGETRSGRPWHPHEGLESLFPIILVSNTLDRLTEELKLDDPQKESVRELLKQRRARFLDLVDRFPPPSLRLGRLAPQATTPDPK